MSGALSIRKPPLYRSRPAGSDCADQGGEALDVEARTPDQAPVDVRFAKKLGDVVRLDAPAIQDAALLRGVGSEPLPDPPANVLVCFLSLRGGGHASGPDGPHRLVCNDEIGHL